VLTEKYNMVRRAFTVLFIILMAFFLVLIFIFPILTSSLRAPVQSQSLISPYWAGYSVASDLINPQPHVTGVSASWTVPTVKVSIGNSFSAAWIGIGGRFDETLIQAGTKQDSIDGVGTYAAWYELLPKNSVTIDSLKVSPGDRITVSISLLNRTTNTCSIEISDITNGQTFKKNFVYDSSMLSAEWIVERPTTRTSISSLTDFGQVTFTNCTARIGDKVGDISSFPSSLFTMVSRMNTESMEGLCATVLPPSSGGSSFTVKYGQ